MQKGKKWEHLWSPWEDDWTSTSITKMPDDPIGLQSARESFRDRYESAVIWVSQEVPSNRAVLHAEFFNMLDGGRAYQLVVDAYQRGSERDLWNKTESVRTGKIHLREHDWFLKHLAAASRGLRLYRDGEAAGFWVRETDAWGRTDPESRVMQASILDRARDDRGKYVLDRKIFMALLEAEFGQIGAAQQRVPAKSCAAEIIKTDDDIVPVGSPEGPLGEEPGNNLSAKRVEEPSEPDKIKSTNDIPSDNIVDATAQSARPAPRQRRRRINEKRPDVVRAIREKGWVKGSLVKPPPGDLPSICQMIDEHLGQPRGTCYPRMLSRAIDDIEAGRL